MYKVFLVDDEELVVKSLKASVDWKEYGFEVAGYALSCDEAYSKIKEIRPDIVFTDIRMPGRSGLELIKGIKEADLNTIFIVVSGYAEFAYAQKAMNYGALGYCLKPFDETEIVNYLKKARTILDATKAINESEIMDLIAENNENSMDELVKVLKEQGIDVNPTKKLRIIVSIGKKKINLGNNLVIKIGRDKYSYFIDHDINGLCSNPGVLKTADIKGIGISREIGSVHEIGNAMNEAEIRAYDFFISREEYNSLFNAPDLCEKDKTIIKLEEAISKKDILSVDLMLENMKQLFSKRKLNINHAIIIYNHVMSFYYRLKSEQYEDYIYSFDKLAESFDDVQEMLLYLKELLLDKNDQNDSCLARSKNYVFNAMVNYVDENYCTNISTQSVSKKFNINANYVSQLFKKETGITFTEYLTQKRIDQACVLLKATDMPISKISEMVGYNDYFYFSRVFKKFMGKSPSSMRVDVF